MSHRRTSFTAASVSITALLLAGCAPAEDDEQPGAEESPQPTQTETETETETVEPSPTSEPSSTEEDEEELDTEGENEGDEEAGAEEDRTGDEPEEGVPAPDEDFSLDPQTSPNWDGFQTDVSYDVIQALTEVRFGQHEGFERVVLEYSGPQELAYEVHYTSPATDVDASTQLLVTVLGANTGAAAREQTHSGIAYPELDDTVFVEAQARTAESEVVIGLKEERPFRVHHAEDPARIIIDIANFRQ